MDEAALYSLPRNLVLAASAGTGKTHALTGVVVHALLGVRLPGDEPVPPARLVATTFSRKAAAEIRGRIEGELERLADPGRAKTSPYWRTLVNAREAHGLAPFGPKEIAARAAAARAGFREAFVGTLHGLATNLLGRHAFEAGLGAGFTMADASLQSELERAALEEAIALALEEDAAGMAKLVDAGGGLATFAEALAVLARTYQEEGIPASELAIDENEASRIERLLAEARAVAAAVPVDSKIHDAAARFVAACDLGDAGEAIEFVRASEGFFGVRLQGKVAKEPAAERLAAFREGLIGSTLGDKGRLFAALVQARADFTPAARSLRLVLSHYEDALLAKMRADGVLGFSEALRAARDLLRDRPEVAGAVSREIDLLLVDECQDVSRLQRDLVVLLFAREETRAPGTIPSFGDVRPRGLFVVGDRKQSIYGFRGADMALFSELAIGLAGAPARLALHTEPLAEEPRVPLADFAALRTNRRGSPPLLAAANALSRRIFTPEHDVPALYEIAYAAETEDLVPPDTSSKSAANASPEIAVEWRRVIAEKSRSSHFEDALATADVVKELLSPPAKGKGKARAAKDIAVLGFSNDVLDQTAFALARMGIPYVLRGLGLHATREAADVGAILRWVLDPSDRLAMAEVLRGPVASASDAALLGLTDERGLLTPSKWAEAPRRALVPPDEAPRLHALASAVGRLHGMAHRLTAFELVSESVRAFGLEDVLARLPLPEARLANTRRTIELAKSAGGPEAFAVFLARARANALREREGDVASDDDDGVRLVTIHASKGLDFPIVIVPEVGGGPQLGTPGFALIAREPGEPPRLAVKLSPSGVLVVSPSFEAASRTERRRRRAERQRLAYVAFTRARERMVFVGYRSPPNDEESDAYASTLSASLASLERDPSTAGWFSAKDVEVRIQPPPIEQTALSFSSIAAETKTERHRPRVLELPIAPTALEDFHYCARRFELVHLFALPEPIGGAPAPTLPRDGALDAAREGSLLHGILERVRPSAFGAPESAAAASRALESLARLDADTHQRIAARASRFLQTTYANELGGTGVRLERELPFVLEVGSAPTVVLRGTIDLLARFPDGTVDVVDYKRARGPNASDYAFQLEVYALAARALFPETARIRVGIVFLGEARPEPRWLPAVDEAATRGRIGALGVSLVLHKERDHFPRAPNETCRAIACGFVARCYPKAT